MPIIEQTEEQRRRAFEDAGVPDVVTGETLAPVEPVDFQTPEPATVFPVDGLDAEFTPLQPTAPEVEAGGMTERLRGLQEQLIGESAFRAGEEERREIPVLEQVQQDLSSQLKILQAEAKAIPISIQQEFAGRGVTKLGVAPIQTARLRENAIKALTVSSLLEASRGNLSLAMEQVDRAVAQKYDPIREEIAVTRANLDLILESPAYSRAEKNRAEQQKATQDARERQINEQEAIDKQIGEIAVNAAQAGADALTLRRIQQSIDPIEATRIASEAGVFAPAPEKLPSDIQTFKQFFPDVDVSTPEGRQQFLNWKAQVGAAGREPKDKIGIPITPEDKRALIGAGFTSEEIDNIESDISTHGIDEVLKGVSEPKQKDAITEVYGGKEVEETKLTRENVATLYELTDDNTKTGWWGFGKTNKEKLDEVMDIIKKYQAVGQTDAQILKIIKEE